MGNDKKANQEESVVEEVKDESTIEKGVLLNKTNRGNNLVLCNLVSRGMSLKDAKRKLGIK